MTKSTTRKLLQFLSVALVFAFAICLFAGCSGHHSADSTKSSSSAQTTTTYPKAKQFVNQPKKTTPTKPTYEDSRWPTRNPDLLAIPESQRWYNAWGSAETTCTIAGPVVNVYQAKESNGMPIFIDIGAAYPSESSVSLVVWGDQYDEFARMINEVDDGGAWLSVTGYLSVYNGRLQFDAGEGYVEYTWWTHAS